jgi:hypothetical protein
MRPAADNGRTLNRRPKGVRFISAEDHAYYRTSRSSSSRFAGTQGFNPKGKYFNPKRNEAKMLSSRSWSPTQFVILPPSKVAMPDLFRNIETDHKRHDQLLASMQRLRGEAYIKDGAIRRSDLTPDGRHTLRIDEHSWHVLSLDRKGQVSACLRYLDESHAVGFESLCIRQAALAQCPEQGPTFRNAVEREMLRARQMRLGFGEVGGWAVAEGRRRTIEPVGILLATYGLLELLGSCLGVAMATFRHASSTILRKIGLASLAAGGVELTPYFDPSYGCHMEVLRFDSRFPNSRYGGWVKELAGILTESPVICRGGVAAAFGGLWNRRYAPAAECTFEVPLAPAAA